MKNGVDINEQDSEGVTPLHLATKLNKYYYIYELIDKEADISCPDHQGYTPLYQAVKNQFIDTVELLLLNHAPVNSLEFEKSPLYIAINQNDMKMVYLLITYGASPSQENEDQESFLSLAMENNNQEIFKLLVYVGASASNITPETLPEPYNKLYTDIYEPPDKDNATSQDFEKTMNVLKEDFDQMDQKLKVAKDKSVQIDFKKNLVSPTINNQNAMISTLTRYIKRVDTHSKMLFRKRVYLISSQMENFAYLEGIRIGHSLEPDEVAWKSMLINLKQTFATIPDLQSDPSLTNQLEDLIQNEGQQIQDVVRITKRLNKDALRKDRAQLHFCNLILVRLLKLIKEITESFNEVKPLIRQTFHNGIDAIESFLDTLNGLRQINYNVASVDPDAEQKVNLDDVLALQHEKLQTDVSYLLYQLQQFDDIAKLTDQCIRMCIQ